MELAQPFESPEINGSVSCETVIEPGNDLTLKVNVFAQEKVSINDINWNHPAALTLDTIDPTFPLTIDAGQSALITVLFKSAPGIEDFGDIELKILFLTSNSSNLKSLVVEHWISIFERAAAAASGLDLVLRKRLVDVVNFKLQNAHIYLGDFERFFDHYLNIEIDRRIADLIREEMTMSLRELPVDEETWHLINIGRTTFYGIKEFELIPEEECNESDDRFDPNGLKENEHPDVDLFA